MDAFYASVELLRYPQLRDVPVVIGGSRFTAQQEAVLVQRWGSLAQVPLHAFTRLGSYVGRGVVTTATYAARQFGVGSAMGLMKAARLCPQAVLLPIDFARYRAYSQRFKEVVMRMAPVMEDRGVDEVYIDLTDVPGVQEQGGRLLALRLQEAIFAATGLTCSIGVAPNKLLAKMAREFHKPRGVAVVWPHDVQSTIWPLPCRKMHGIGPKANAKLAQLGITTIGQLAAYPVHRLVQQFGRSMGLWLHQAAQGLDDRPVQTHSEPVSCSRETTFAQDLHAVQDKAQLGATFTWLCERVAEDLQRQGYGGRTVGIKLRFSDFRCVTREMTVDALLQDSATIRRLAGLCLRRAPLTQRIRLLGVRVGGLQPWPTAAGETAGSGAASGAEVAGPEAQGLGITLNLF